MIGCGVDDEIVGYLVVGCLLGVVGVLEVEY